MAVTTIETNNKLIRFTEQINTEWFQENMFSPYQSEDLNAIIRIRNELKQGGEDMNIPLVSRLTGAGVATGTLVGNEEKIDNYGMRVRLEWARNAVVTTKAEKQKDSADIFGEAKPLLSGWLGELRRDETIAGLMALPSETLPTSSTGVRVNGIQYDLATATQRNTWNTDNQDRILYGSLVSNWTAVHSAALAAVQNTAIGRLTAANVSLMKRLALNANPHIRPYRTKDGYENYVMFAGSNTFRDLKNEQNTLGNLSARPREQIGFHNAPNNPLFQDGDLILDGVIVRQVPQITSFVTNVWTTLLTAGATTSRVEPVFLCGQQAAVMAVGQMAKPTFRKEDDYGFIDGVGIEAAYGLAKMFKKHPNTGTKLVQWGVVTGFMFAPAD